MNPSPKLSLPYPEEFVCSLAYYALFPFQIQPVLCSEITMWTELFPFPYKEGGRSPRVTLDMQVQGTGHFMHGHLLCHRDV